MKTSTLNFICIMFVLLDMITSPTGCGDHHHKSPRRDVAITGMVRSVDSTWAEIEGEVYLDNIAAYCSPVEFGVEYSDSTDKSMSNAVRIAASSMEEESFKVKITGLEPSKTYAYRTYLQCTSNVSYEGGIYYFHTLKAAAPDEE